MLPSQDAVTMKRDQEEVKEKNITALLDRKKQLQALLVQADIDLQHVGYNPLGECAGPVRYTRSEWQEAIRKEGYELMKSGSYNSLVVAKKEDEHTIVGLFKKIGNLERKNKILRSKLWAKQAKDAKPRKRKAVKK